MEHLAVVRTLVELGHLTAAELLDDGIAVRDASRRNSCAVVRRGDGGGFAVKAGGDLARERQRYKALASITRCADIAPHAVAYDDGLLVLDVQPRAADLHELGPLGAAADADIGAALGSVLGRFHRMAPLGLGSADTGPPDIFGIARPAADALRTYSYGAIELVTTLQGHPPLPANIAAAREMWRDATAIHGDLKWPNIVVVPRRGIEPPLVQLIDWEDWRDGDPAWDVGSAIAGYLSCWLASMPETAPGRDVEDAVAQARTSLEDVRPAVRALWDAYVDEAPHPPEDRDELLRRSVVFSAIRLIRTAFEESCMRSRMSEAAARHLQVAANVLNDPEGALKRLLQLPA